MNEQRDHLKELLSLITARLSVGDVWLCYDESVDKWSVYQRKYGQKKTRTLYQGDRHGAVDVMLREASEE